MQEATDIATITDKSIANLVSTFLIYLKTFILTNQHFNSKHTLAILIHIIAKIKNIERFSHLLFKKNQQKAFLRHYLLRFFTTHTYKQDFTSLKINNPQPDCTY